MKPLLRNIIAAAVGAASAILLVVLDRESRRAEQPLTCSGVSVTILDSAKVSFITKDDVKKYILQEIGPWIGQKPDSLKLWKIEETLLSKQAVLSCNAYLKGSRLFIDVMQREPVVELEAADGRFYADMSGYLFPVLPKYSCDVPLVKCDLQISDSKRQKWLSQMISMVDFTTRSKKWQNLFSGISADKEGDIVLTPCVGEEIFIFGQPIRIEEKFSKIEKYYQYIAHAENSREYKSVNVSFKRQIICR